MVDASAVKQRGLHRAGERRMAQEAAAMAGVKSRRNAPTISRRCFKLQSPEGIAGQRVGEAEGDRLRDRGRIEVRQGPRDMPAPVLPEGRRLAAPKARGTRALLRAR